MTERTGECTIKGNPLTLLGDKLDTGAQAPDVELVANDLSGVKLSKWAGKVRILPWRRGSPLPPLPLPE